jgi:hypothetical protein
MFYSFQNTHFGLFFFFEVLGIEPKAQHMVGKCFITEPHPYPFKNYF